MLLVLALLAVMAPQLLAAAPQEVSAARASSYFSKNYAYISSSGGTISVSFYVKAYSTMTSLGASKIQIYNSSGSVVKTFYSSSTSGMLGSNCSTYSGSVSYTGTSGTKYYAAVTFYASNSGGSGKAYATTDTVTVTA